MKFSAREGSSARTLAVDSGWARSGASAPPAPRRESRPRLGSAATLAPPEQNGASPGQNGASPGQPMAGASSRNISSFKKDQVIFGPGQGEDLIYIVRSGFIRLYKTLPDGRSINLGLLGPNTIFAQEEYYEGLSSGATAEAMVDSTISVVAVNDLASVIEESPQLAGAMVQGMTRRLTELQTLTGHLLVRDTSVRLASTLLSLMRAFGRPAGDGWTRITMPLTHQRLAGMIGSNRVTVTRNLLDLQRQDVVRSAGRHSLMVNVDALLAHARSAADSRTESASTGADVTPGTQENRE